MSYLVVMNHAKVGGAASSPEVPSSMDVRRPTSTETVELADRNTLYRSHDYEELPTSRFLSIIIPFLFADVNVLTMVVCHYHSSIISPSCID